MRNLEIHFSHPIVLWLIVVAAILTLIPYFRLAKRYRKTRNRITSIVLHMIVMVLAVTTLAGIRFDYEIPNDENEIIVLVDMSETEEQSQQARDEFVRVVLDDSRFDNYKVGVVTFGFDQEYAVPLTYDVEKVYDRYLKAATPDTSATNIAAALEYTKDLFENPATAKIVLVTDGKETDKKANDVIRDVAAQGTKVDIAHITSSYEGNDVQIVGIELPDYHINVGEECTIKVLVQSRTTTTALVELTDKGVATEQNTVATEEFDLIEGLQTLSMQYTFTWEGLHQLQASLKLSGDLLEENNVYSSYLYLEVYNNILVLERTEGESDAFVEMMNANVEIPYKFTVKTVYAEDLPKTVDELRLYDQVVLNNISNDDLKKAQTGNPELPFDVMLETYVNEYGGGLFTIGGKDEEGNANAYNRQDMYGSLYQQMLPVQAINYTPPVGVVIIIDRSGSMADTDNFGDVKLDAAKAGASACLSVLTERDYVGIMTLDDQQSIVLDMTPRTQEAQILAAIDSIKDANGGTVFPEAIQTAGIMLRALEKVDKRHIMLVSDGEVTPDQKEAYETYIQNYYEVDKITFSVIAIGQKEGTSAYKDTEKAVALGHGRLYTADNASELIYGMREDLNAPEITEVTEETFSPIVHNLMSPLLKGVQLGTEENFNKFATTLDGFFGVKVRSSAELVLVGDYEVPIYAQWKYGKGMVGSFMCDLNGGWSSTFMADESGQTFIRNVVNNLMPTETIRPSNINFDLKENNYINQLSIYSPLDETKGEYYKGELIATIDGEEVKMSLNEVTAGNAETLRSLPCYVTTALSASNHYSRCDFVVKQGGTYKIVLTKCDAQGNVIKTDEQEVKVEIYKTFAYSEEYNSFTETIETEVKQTVQKWAERGNGVVIEDIEDPWEVFNGFVTALPKSFDPRVLFMIIAIVLFLLDVAVRKFKFKWPHELIREYRKKKEDLLRK